MLSPRHRSRLGGLVLAIASVVAGTSVAAGTIAVPATAAGGVHCANKMGGTASSDVLSGTRGGDTIVAKGGRDTLRGLDAADCLRGGAGEDRLAGGAGSDRLAGGAGADVIRARDGSPDKVQCGSGRDKAIVDAADVVRKCERVEDPQPRPGPGALVPPASGYAPSSHLGPIPVGAHYVSTSGSDSAAGTEAAPWRTVAKAVASVGPGDTVVIEPGSYGALGTTTSFSSAGTAAAPVTFRGHPDKPMPQILGRTRIDADYQRLNYLLFDGPTGPVKPPTSDNPDGEDVQVSIYGDAIDGVEISDSEIRNSGWHAGIFASTANDVRITGNYIHDNGDFADPVQANASHGIYFSSGSGLIANNVIEHNVARGIQLYQSPHHVTIANNTVVGNGKAGILFGNQTADSIAVNNLVANNGEYGIRASSLTGSGNVVQRNLVWGNPKGNLGLTDGLTLLDNIQSDPGFGESQDYHPQAASPAIDAGLASFAPPVDFDGAPRPLGAAPDLGAFEVG